MELHDNLKARAVSESSSAWVVASEVGNGDFTGGVSISVEEEERVKNDYLSTSSFASRGGQGTAYCH